jgi:hypothetical protein
MLRWCGTTSMQIYGWSIATDKHREAMLHHTVQRMLSFRHEHSYPGGLALLRVATGVIVAWLHGWHKVVEGPGWRSASRQVRTSL